MRPNNNVFIILACVAACGNETGNVTATKLGDTSSPALRGSPLEELREACGDGAMTDRGEIIKRLPYLQQVTTTSAMIGWVTTAPDGEHVIVTTPDGAPVSQVPAERQASPQQSPSESQMWATLTDLEPGTTYCYALASDTPRSGRIGFRTAPEATSDEPVRFLAFGDSGGGSSDQMALLDRMYEFPYDLIIHTGDIAYDDGTLAQYEDNVFGVYSELFQSVPFFPTSGNHDYKTRKGGPYRDVFALPGDSGEKWYSYDWGNVHFVALDTEQDYATQARWLDADLAASEQPWTIVYMHRPPYSSGDHGSDVKLRETLGPVLEKHGVQLVLSGHDHDYERMIPQGGVHYIVTGGGGVGTKNVGKSAFTAFSEEVVHFLYVEVTGDELVVHAIDATGVEFDSLVIEK